MVIFAILVAAVGLNVNSTVVIIGAMPISPLMGPIVGSGTATTELNPVQLGLSRPELVQEKVSYRKERPTGLRLLALPEGDTLAVGKLERLGRSRKDLVTGFQVQGVRFVNLQDHLATTTTHGRLMFSRFTFLAEFERELIREQTKAGLTAARGR